MPMFIYKSVHDELSNIAETDSLVDQFCKNGGNVLYHRNTAGNHDAEIINGRPAVLKFLAGVLDGGNSESGVSKNGCTVANVTVDLVSSWLSNH